MQAKLALWCGLTLRAILLGAAMFGCLRLCLGEYRYARGMSATSVQQSLDYLTEAAYAYPWEFKFRTAQAMQLYELAQHYPAVVPAAAESLRLAEQVDPNSAEIVSKLFGAQWAAQDYAAAIETGKRLVKIAPESDKARRMTTFGMP